MFIFMFLLSLLIIYIYIYSFFGIYIVIVIIIIFMNIIIFETIQTPRPVVAYQNCFQVSDNAG